MTDLLVRLYALPDPASWAVPEGMVIRRALPPERRLVVGWVAENFHDVWAAECEVALSGLPVTMWIAERGGALVGFACHDATAKGLFGPTAVLEGERGRGIGKALLLTVLTAMREAGYAYAIVGGAGPLEFYQRNAGAEPIAGSDPGLYRGMLRAK